MLNPPYNTFPGIYLQQVSFGILVTNVFPHFEAKGQEYSEGIKMNLQFIESGH